MCLVGVAAAAVRSNASVARTAQTAVVSGRTASRIGNASRTRGAVTRTTVGQTNRNPRGAITTAAERTTTRTVRAASSSRASSRAATTGATVATTTFDNRYDQCQNAYFTCMDQFCATIDDKYRRCICSSKIDTVKARERALTQAGYDLADFQNLNIAVIPKTKEEVKSMLSASTGELKLSDTVDKSDSAKKLAAIGDVLALARNKTMSNAGQVDIAGDIKQIWTTTDLISGADIANLTGVALYNSVHSQCAEFVTDQCPSVSVLNMVASAYGMYIENDCAALLAALDKDATAANATIRAVGREMTSARLDNYNAHNSAEINECVSAVRDKITADSACGADFVHCLDLTGLYLNRITGEPIYTENFYKLDGSVSLAGDVLTNAKNAKIVAELKGKRKFAERVLDTCRDIADTVWDEFMRIAITEIYQGQQERIRNVKNQCMDVVNQCYDKTAAQLRDYTNIAEQLLIGDRLELSEEMCNKYMNTCSNLYGGGTQGLELLLTEMRNITDQKIAQNCLGTLTDYAKKLCRVTSTDASVSYPYGCRIYAPGDILYAQNPDCTYIHYASGNYDLELPTGDVLDITESTAPDQYSCHENRIYSACNPDYFLQDNKCYKCPTDWTCSGGTNLPQRSGAYCSDYAGSLYQKMVVYALQYCVRPSTSNEPIPTSILEQVNTLMDSIRVDMAHVLESECTRMGGTWKTALGSDTKFDDFYNATNADTGWGICVQ